MAKITDRLLLQKPQIRLGRSSIARMWLVCLCAFLAIIQSSLTDSFSSLVIALSAVSAAVLTEFLFYQEHRLARLKDGSSIATALILTLLLPNRIPPAYAAMGTVFAIAVVKHSFGGIGSNWLNPAAGGWIFIRLSWPNAFDKALEGSSFSLLEQSFSGRVADIQEAGSVDSAIRTFLNDTVFAFTGSELPGGYIDLFAFAPPGIIADRGIFALLLGTIILCAAQVNRSWIPITWILFYAFFTRISGDLHYGGEWGRGDLFFALFSGGAIASAFILNADPASSAKSNIGYFIALVISGVLAWFLRYHCGEPYGAIYAVAVVNALLPLIRAFERRFLYEKPFVNGAEHG